MFQIKVVETIKTHIFKVSNILQKVFH